MRQHDLVLILARDLADKLASAVFVVDREGTLVYFNEAAAEILGRSFGEVGHMPEEEWSRAFIPVDPEGHEIHPRDLPLAVVLRERRPVHRSFRIHGLDGGARDVACTALPLFARRGEFVGAAAIFWEEPEPGARQPEPAPAQGPPVDPAGGGP
ncbi:MAG TPA: PAS domain-containing protein [Actinomycetota bacterium]|nr:PAS domain-containing protein [Actinomycetota bacterium]